MAARNDASRREILKAVGVGVSTAAIAGVVSQSTPLAAAASVSSKEPSVNDTPSEAAAAQVVEPSAPAYLGDLAGSRLGPYTVVSVGALDRGGIPVVLATAAGDTFRVDVLRVGSNDPRKGIGLAGSVSAYLRNGGDGRTATDEERGLGAMALAEELHRREKAGVKPPSTLLTLAERESLDRVRAS